MGPLNSRHKCNTLYWVLLWENTTVTSRLKRESRSITALRTASRDVASPSDWAALPRRSPVNSGAMRRPTKQYAGGYKPDRAHNLAAQAQAMGGALQDGAPARPQRSGAATPCYGMVTTTDRGQAGSRQGSHDDQPRVNLSLRLSPHQRPQGLLALPPATTQKPPRSAPARRAGQCADHQTSPFHRRTP